MLFLFEEGKSIKMTYLLAINQCYKHLYRLKVFTLYTDRPGVLRPRQIPEGGQSVYLTLGLTVEKN